MSLCSVVVALVVAHSAALAVGSLVADVGRPLVALAGLVLTGSCASATGCS